MGPCRLSNCPKPNWGPGRVGLPRMLAGGVGGPPLCENRLVKGLPGPYSPASSPEGGPNRLVGTVGGLPWGPKGCRAMVGEQGGLSGEPPCPAGEGTPQGGVEAPEVDGGSGGRLV